VKKKYFKNKNSIRPEVPEIHPSSLGTVGRMRNWKNSPETEAPGKNFQQRFVWMKILSLQWR